MKNTEKAFLKYNILNSLQGPSYYILTILFSVFLSGNYFIRQQFFSGNGSTDLLLFFSAVPYISIIAVPALCYRHSFAIYDDFIPLPSIKKIWLTFLSRFILYSIMILLLLPSALLVNLYGSIDWGQLFTGFICLFFYGAAVISVCTFIEKLINNRILSFVISAVILAIFNAAHLRKFTCSFSFSCKRTQLCLAFRCSRKGYLRHKRHSLACRLYNALYLPGRLCYR